MHVKPSSIQNAYVRYTALNQHHCFKVVVNHLLVNIAHVFKKKDRCSRLRHYSRCVAIVTPFPSDVRDDALRVIG